VRGSKGGRKGGRSALAKLMTSDIGTYVNLRRFTMRDVQGSRFEVPSNSECGMWNEPVKRET